MQVFSWQSTSSALSPPFVSWLPFILELLQLMPNIPTNMHQSFHCFPCSLFMLVILVTIAVRCMNRPKPPNLEAISQPILSVLQTGDLVSAQVRSSMGV